MKRIAVLLLMTFVTCWFISVSTGLAVPLPPEMSLEKTGISVEIIWTSSVGADGYRLYYAAYPYTGPTSIGSIDVGEETEINFTLWKGASYYVAVTAYDETGESRYSNTELFLLGPYTTDHTEGTPELSIDTDALEVATSWTEVTGANSYRLYYAPYPFTDSDTIGNFDMGDSTEADFTLWDGAAFYVAMTAEENGNESGYSNVELLLTGDPIPEWQNLGYTDGDEDGYSTDEGDCDDGDASASPLGVEVCGDNIDQDCNGEDAICAEDIDSDGDGYSANQGDCDDSDSSLNPDAAEICGDGIDQDCDGSDEVCPVDPNDDVDDDNDGYTESQGDCNDGNSTIRPGSTEICGDGIDQDCSGSDLACPVTCSGEIINPISLSIGTSLNQTIAAFGTKYYVFEVSVMGEYTIALYNMTTDNDWKLGEYVSNCEDDYSVDQAVIAASSNLNTTDEIKTVQLWPKKYLLVVDEWNNLASSYTLSVTR